VYPRMERSFLSCSHFISVFIVPILLQSNLFRHRVWTETGLGILLCLKWETLSLCQNQCHGKWSFGHHVLVLPSPVNFELGGRGVRKHLFTQHVQAASDHTTSTADAILLPLATSHQPHCQHTSLKLYPRSLGSLVISVKPNTIQA